MTQGSGRIRVAVPTGRSGTHVDPMPAPSSIGAMSVKRTKDYLHGYTSAFGIFRPKEAASAEA